MLAFIIPVKHPASSRSYARVLELLRKTLQSIGRSTDPGYVVVIVSQSRPAWANTVSNAVFVEVDFPPPDPPSSQQDAYTWIFRDKGCRNAVGLLHAARFQPSHIMFTDADDLVSNRLVPFVNASPAAAGYYMSHGYVYSNRFKLIERRDEFWSYCGTSHIIRADLLPVPRFSSMTPSKPDIVSAFDPRYLERILGDHNQLRRYCAEQGSPLAPLPFPGAIWRADTGENSSRRWWQQQRFGPIRGRSPTEEQVTEFALEREPRRLADSARLAAWRARTTMTGLCRRFLSAGGRYGAGRL